MQPDSFSPHATAAQSTTPPTTENTAPPSPSAGLSPEGAGAPAERVAAETARPCGIESLPVIDPVPSIAGLEPIHPIRARTGLWRRIRQETPPEPAAAEPAESAPPPLPDEKTADAQAPARTGRFPLLAGCVALAAAVGAAAGAAGVAGAAKLVGVASSFFAEPAPSAAPAPQRADLAEDTKALREAMAQLRGSVRALSENVATLKANLDASAKATAGAIGKLHEQFGKLHDSVERLERAHAEPAARLAKLTDALERLERRAAGPAASEVTGSVSTQASRTAEVAKQNVVEGWVLRRVYDGVALIEGRYGAIEVEPGDVVHGLGRIHDIRRQDGRWVVVTNRGLIVGR